MRNISVSDASSSFSRRCSTSTLKLVCVTQSCAAASRAFRQGGLSFEMSVFRSIRHQPQQRLIRGKYYLSVILGELLCLYPRGPAQAGSRRYAQPCRRYIEGFHDEIDFEVDFAARIEACHFQERPESRPGGQKLLEDL